MSGISNEKQIYVILKLYTYLALHILTSLNTLRKSPTKYHLETMYIGSVGHPPLKLVSCALLGRYHDHLILLTEEYPSSKSLNKHIHQRW